MSRIGMKDLLQIMSGSLRIRFKEVDLVVNGPSVSQLYAAEVFAEEQYIRAFEEGCYTQDDIENLLMDKGLWSEQKDQMLEAIPKSVEKLKIDYFYNFTDSGKRKQIAKQLKRIESLSTDLLNQKYLYFEHTCEGIRSTAVNTSLIRDTTFTFSGEKFNFDAVSPRVILFRCAQGFLSSDTIRKVSLDDSWRSIWGACKNTHELFGRSADMTNEQISLISWSRMYDSVFESPDCPNATILEDSIALDGWLIVQREKRKDESLKREGDKVSSKMDSAGEVFIMAHSKEDEKRVSGMNTRAGKNRINSRYNELKENGSLYEQDFGLIKRDLQMEAIRLGKEGK